MFVRRLTADLKQQKWTTITIELIIVIIGVFIGTQVSNWNEGRLERDETRQMLLNLGPELRNDIAGFDAVRAYYRVTRHYAVTAFAGWRGDPNISDRDFVIAAYQASQNTFTGINNSSWSQIFGSERLHTVDDQTLREELGALMTTDYNVIEKEIFSNYREHVRQVIPEDIQDAIRAGCSDQRFGLTGFTRLPPTCTLALPDERFRIAAKALRDHPELVGEMRWHFAAVATYVDNISNLEDISRRALKRIEQMG
jgi:hypothetical protein